MVAAFCFVSMYDRRFFVDVPTHTHFETPLDRFKECSLWIVNYFDSCVLCDSSMRTIMRMRHDFQASTVCA